MKKFFAVLSVLGLVMGTKVLADDTPASTLGVSVTPASSSSVGSSGRSSKKKKSKTHTISQPTFTPTPVMPVKPSPTPTLSSPVKTQLIATPTPTPAEFSSNIQLYDRIGANGDLRQAVALAAKTLGSSYLKHDRSVFLWLGKVSNGDTRQNTYLRLNVNGVELGGPRKPWIVLTGVVYDQAGSDFKAGDAIEVAVDFRDVKVDYEGTKLGEVQKGNDIADQFFELLNTHPTYQWVLLAQDRLRDPMNPNEVPAFLVNAREGYVFLESLNASRDRSHSNPSDH